LAILAEDLKQDDDVVSIISSAVSSESSTAMLDSAEKSTEEKDRVKKIRPSPCGITDFPGISRILFSSESA
jgi:hypothetical protein